MITAACPSSHNAERLRFLPWSPLSYGLKTGERRPGSGVRQTYGRSCDVSLVVALEGDVPPEPDAGDRRHVTLMGPVCSLCPEALAQLPVPASCHESVPLFFGDDEKTKGVIGPSLQVTVLNHSLIDEQSRSKKITFLWVCTPAAAQTSYSYRRCCCLAVHAGADGSPRLLCDRILLTYISSPPAPTLTPHHSSQGSTRKSSRPI